MSIDTKTILVVESASKAKTLKDIFKLDLGYSNITVIITKGQVVQLGNSGPFNAGVDPNNNFSLDWHLKEDSKKFLALISKSAPGANVYIITEPSAEGEFFMWSILKFCELDPQHTGHLRLTEFSSEAITTQLNSPNELNLNLVHAGMARLALDKLFGYSLSPFIKKNMGTKSIGRYQVGILNALLERELALIKVVPEMVYTPMLLVGDRQLKFKGSEIKCLADAQTVVTMGNQKSFYIKSIKKVKANQKPKEVFNLLTLIKAAQNINISAVEVCLAALRLYEGIKLNNRYTGLITWPKTDSTQMSKKFQEELSQYIIAKYGKNKISGSVPKTGFDGIRVVNLAITPNILKEAKVPPVLIEVYQLIWERTIDTLKMPKKVYLNNYIVSNGLYSFTFTEEADIPLDSQLVSNNLTNTTIKLKKEVIMPLHRYTQGELAGDLRMLGIISTYSYLSASDKLLKSNKPYIYLNEDTLALTDIGTQVIKYCKRCFGDLINPEQLRFWELSLRQIETGELDYKNFLEDFYKRLIATTSLAKKQEIVDEPASKICARCGNLMTIKRSRFGKLFYGCSNFPKCTYTTNI